MNVMVSLMAGKGAASRVDGHDETVPEACNSQDIVDSRRVGVEVKL